MSNKTAAAHKEVRYATIYVVIDSRLPIPTHREAQEVCPTQLKNIL